MLHFTYSNKMIVCSTGLQVQEADVDDDIAVRADAVPTNVVPVVPGKFILQIKVKWLIII